MFIGIEEVNILIEISFKLTFMEYDDSRPRKLGMQRFYLAFCDILHVTHLYY